MDRQVKKNSGPGLKGLPMELLESIETFSKQLGISRIALVGGAVRDSIMQGTCENNPNEIKDIDLVVEGSAIELASFLHVHLGNSRVTELHIYPIYDTAEMKIDGWSFDLASARVETYSDFGENPQVTNSDLESDLARRDFTINSIAFDCSLGVLIDPFKGKADLSNGHLAFLHPRSVAEDPTRVIRGARYGARLKFELTPSALQQVRSTLIDWPWRWQHGDPIEIAPPALSTRLRLEFELLLSNEPWEDALKKLQSWGALSMLDKKLQQDKNLVRRINWAARLGVEKLTALVAGAEDSLNLGERLKLARHEIKNLEDSQKFEIKLLNLSLEENLSLWPASRWCNEIESNNLRPQAVALCICKGIPMWKQLLGWWGRWRKIKSPISANKLIDSGWEAGPELGEKLRDLRYEEIDRLISRKYIPLRRT